MSTTEALFGWCQLESPFQIGLLFTNEIGVSFKILARILWPSSPSPEMQTLVTCPLGRLCSDWAAFNSEEVTDASTLPALCSLICRQSFLRASILSEWTGSLCMGVPSAVPTGNVQRWNAAGLEWSTSSTSGPGKLDAKGTLKARLTIESTELWGAPVGGP